MSRVFITGSADGLGQLAAKSLIAQGHKVVLHARNEQRGRDAMAAAPGAENVVVADLSNIDHTIQLASKVNELGRFDAVIHNAGVYNTTGREMFMVNSLAPYILTCLIQKPERLIYLSSGMNRSGHTRLETVKTKISNITYSDTKLHVILLCNAVARKWPDVYANALDPGWVPTKMGGRGAPDDLQKGYETQVWLAVSNDEKAKVSGRFFFHQKETRCNPDAADVELQEKFMELCRELTGIELKEQNS